MTCRVPSWIAHLYAFAVGAKIFFLRVVDARSPTIQLLSNFVFGTHDDDVVTCIFPSGEASPILIALAHPALVFCIEALLIIQLDVRIAAMIDVVPCSTP